MRDRNEIEELKAELHATRAMTIALTVAMAKSNPKFAEWYDKPLKMALKNPNLGPRRQRAIARLPEEISDTLDLFPRGSP